MRKKIQNIIIAEINHIIGYKQMKTFVIRLFCFQISMNYRLFFDYKIRWITDYFFDYKKFFNDCWFEKDSELTITENILSEKKTKWVDSKNK